MALARPVLPVIYRRCRLRQIFCLCCGMTPCDFDWSWALGRGLGNFPLCGDFSSESQVHLPASAESPGTSRLLLVGFEVSLSLWLGQLTVPLLLPSPLPGEPHSSRALLMWSINPSSCKVIQALTPFPLLLTPASSLELQALFPFARLDLWGRKKCFMSHYLQGLYTLRRKCRRILFRGLSVCSRNLKIQV